MTNEPITIDLPDHVYEALCLRAASNGRSAEAEICIILEEAIKVKKPIKLGSYMLERSQKVGGLTDEECELFNSIRDKSAAQPIKFE